MAEPRDAVISFRVTSEFSAAVNEAARLRKMSVANLVRLAVQQLLATPIGYACEHFNITSRAGALAEVNCPAGCVMRPVFHRSEVELADA